MKKRILITGGAGFIGSNLIQKIINETQDEIINLDKLTYAGNLSSLGLFKDDPRYKLERVDLCDAAAVSEVVTRARPDAIMHLAAESHVDRSIDGPGEFIQTNILGTFNLLQAACGHWQSLEGDAKKDFRFHHISTDEVYGSLTNDEPGFTEITAYDPHSPYSASKASSDHLVRSWADTYGLPVLITNCSNNYGPYQFPEKLIPVVILKCLNLEAIPVYGKGDNIRDWLHVSDHCAALCAVLERGQPGRTYNIGGNNEMRNIDLVRLLCSILDELVPLSSDVKPSKYEELITYVTDRPGHDLRYAIDASRIRDELGWEPSETAETGFKKTVQWYLDNKEWWQNILNGSYRFERQGIFS